MRNADDSQLETLGRAVLELRVGEMILVFGNRNQLNGIMAMDFLLSNHASLDLKRMELSLNG